MRSRPIEGRAARRTDFARPGILSRRQVVAGALGAAGVSALGAGLTDLRSLVAAQDGATLRQPDVWPSENGLLKRTLRAKLDTARGPGGLGYEGGGVGFAGLVPGPTLRLEPGDRLKLRLENQLGAFTNIHVHGLHVSPQGHSDNVFVQVELGGWFDYEFQIPDDHPTGLFWYHPHYHMFAQDQVNQGLAGAIIIADGPDEPPDVKDVAAENLLVLQRLDPELVPNESYYVNGQVRPKITIQQGTRQLWRILNASSDTFFNIRVDGHLLRRVGVDGNWIPNYGDYAAIEILPLGPAERADVLIEGGAAGTYDVQALWDANGPSTPVFAESATINGVTIATLESVEESAPEAGAGSPAPAATPGAEPPEIIDLRGYSGIRKRDIRFGMNDETFTFEIDHRGFNPDRVDQTVELDAVEEWTIFNETDAAFGWHPFHLHVNDFDVLQTSHQGLQGQFYQDTVPVPPTDENGQGQAVIRTQFADFTGKFVYHCHFLFHEDRGMMAVVEVVRPVKVTGSGFDPPDVTVTAETTVLWTNHDEGEHTISAADGSFTSGPLGRGQSFAHTFDTPGAVAYHDDAGREGSVAVTLVKTIEISGNGFDPEELHIDAGTTVLWTNRDAEPRTVSAADGSFLSTPIAHKTSFSHTFSAAGSIAYESGAPAPKQGVIVVGEAGAPPRATVWITDAGFDPPELHVEAGTIVTWANRGSTAHTVTVDSTVPGQHPLDSGELAAQELFRAGPRFSHRFDGPGTVAYHCRVDPSLQATVVVA